MLCIKHMYINITQLYIDGCCTHWNPWCVNWIASWIVSLSVPCTTAHHQSLNRIFHDIHHGWPNHFCVYNLWGHTHTHMLMHTSQILWWWGMSWSSAPVYIGQVMRKVAASAGLVPAMNELAHIRCRLVLHLASHITRGAFVCVSRSWLAYWGMDVLVGIWGIYCYYICLYIST